MKDIELNSERIQFKKTNPKNESQNIFPSKYMKEKYPHLYKVVPRNSILFKVQYKPDSSYKEYLHTTYNNKDIKKLQNIINSSPININNNQTNNNQINNPEQKYYEIHTNNTLLNYLDENDFKNYSNQKNYEEILIQSSGFKPINNESSFQNFLIEKNNLNNEFIINPINSNEITRKEKRIIKNKITKDKDYVINEYLKINNYSNNKKGRTFKIQKNNNLNIDEMNIKNNYENKYNINTSNNLKNYNNNLYLKYKNNILDSNDNFEYGHQVINSIENLNYNSYKTKNLTTNFNDNYSKESFRSHKIDTFLSPNNLTNTNKILESKNNNNIDNIEDTNKGLNIKLNYYRIRLFKEFIKHFQKFCKVRLKKYFSMFLKNLNNKYRNINKNIYEYNNKTIRNIESKKVIIFSNNDISDDLLVNKSKTGRNVKNLYKKINTDNIKNHNLNNINYTNEISNILKDKNYIKSDPRIRKNNKIIFIKRNSIKKNTETNSINTLSPSFHFKNSTLINKNISFRTEENIKENELFRNTKELNEKMKQIQTRKNRSKFKNNNNFMLKSTNIEKTIKSDIDSQFNKIRKYMRSIKKNKNYKIQNIEILDNNQTNEINENKKINRISQNKNIIRINNMFNINKVNSDYDYNKNENLDKYNTDNKEHSNVIENSNNISSEKIIFNYNNENPKNKAKYLVNNNREFSDKKKAHIVLPNQNYFYYNKIKDNNKNIKNHKVYSVIIKNLSTSDGRINIYINYYFLIRKNKPLITKYNHLRIVKTLSLNFIYIDNDININDNNNSDNNNINNISNDNINNIDNDNINNIDNNNINNIDNNNNYYNNKNNNDNDNNNINKKMNKKKYGPKLRPKLSSIQEEESQNQLSNERKENTKINSEIYEKKFKNKRKNNNKNKKNNVDRFE